MGSFKLGAVEVPSVYLGDIKVYEALPPFTHTLTVGTNGVSANGFTISTFNGPFGALVPTLFEGLNIIDFYSESGLAGYLTFDTVGIWSSIDATIDGVVFNFVQNTSFNETYNINETQKVEFDTLMIASVGNDLLVDMAIGA